MILLKISNRILFFFLLFKIVNVCLHVVYLINIHWRACDFNWILNVCFVSGNTFFFHVVYTLFFSTVRNKQAALPSPVSFKNIGYVLFFTFCLFISADNIYRNKLHTNNFKHLSLSQWHFLFKLCHGYNSVWCLVIACVYYKDNSILWKMLHLFLCIRKI